MAAKTVWEKAFCQGYICACAVLISGHGESTEVTDTLSAGGYSLEDCEKNAVDEHDLKLIEPTLKQIQERNERNNKEETKSE